jgi:hypothetical protein
VATLDDIVNVQIDLNTAAVGRANFGTICVFAQQVGTHTAGKVETYQRFADVPADVPAVARGMIQAIFSQHPRASQVKVAYVADAGALTAEDLQKALDSDNRWYCAVIAHASQNQQDFAKALEATRHLLVLTVAESVQGVAIARALKTLNLYRTAVIASSDINTGAAWAARSLGYQAGSETWALKRLAGVTASTMSATLEGQLQEQNASFFARHSSDLSVTRGGKVAAGEWIDVIRFRDWLQDAMQTNLVTMLVNRPKLPYTDEGLEVIAATMIKTLQEGVRAGGVIDWRDDGEGNQVPGYDVSVPRAADVPFNIKASRVANVGFTAYLTGAIHAVNVTGSFTYEGAI